MIIWSLTSFRRFVTNAVVAASGTSFFRFPIIAGLAGISRRHWIALAIQNFITIHSNSAKLGKSKKLFLFLLLLLLLIMHPTKCYTNPKVRAPSEKNQLWTSASSSVSQKSQDQLSDPSAIHSDNLFQGPAQQQRLTILKPQFVQWLGTTRSLPTVDLFSHNVIGIVRNTFVIHKEVMGSDYFWILNFNRFVY